MSDSDKSLNNLRYNQVTQGLEGAGGGSPIWTPLVLTADGGINQLTGDATAGPGSGSQALTLATVNSNVGSFINANITVDAKGRITAAANGSGGSVSPYSPTINGFGIPTSVQFFYKTDGATVTVWGAFIAGTTAGPANISVPITIATVHMPSNVTVLGTFLVGLGLTAPQNIIYDGSTATMVSINIQNQNTDGNPIQLSTGDNLANVNDYVTVVFTYPII